MKGLLNYRTGQGLNLAGLGSVALALLVAAIVLGLGATILDKMQDAQTDTQTSHSNESFTFINDTAQGFLEGTVLTSSIKVYNGTHLIPSSGNNYTVTVSTITFINDTDDTQWSGVADDLNVSYDYTIGSAALNSTTFGLSGMTTLSEFIPTIAIVAAAGILIGLVLVLFGRRKTE